MRDLASLVRKLSDVQDEASAAEALAAHAVDGDPEAACRVWLMGLGDRCATCARASACHARERCLHVAASLGAFAHPAIAIERIPAAELEVEALGSPPGRPRPPGPLMRAPRGSRDGAECLLPLVAGGTRLGLLGLRTEKALDPDRHHGLEAAVLLAAATLRHVGQGESSLGDRRGIDLAGDLARAAGGILDEDLLLGQVVADIQRTFDLGDVAVYLKSSADAALECRARASVEGNEQRATREPAPPVPSPVERALKRAAPVVDHEGLRTEAAYPIHTGQSVGGALHVRADRPLVPAEQHHLEVAASQIAMALGNARLLRVLRVGEGRYRSLVEASPTGVLQLDRQGRVVFQNPAGRLLTGVDEEDGRAILSGLVCDEDHAALERALAQALAGTPHPEVALRLERPDGSTCWVDACFEPLTDDESRPAGAVVLARDRSSEIELRERLYQAEKLSSIGGMVSGVAHELNNPLAGILGYAQLLLSDAPERWSRGDLEKIEHNARRCQAIVANLLQFARQSRQRKSPANLNEVIESVLKLNEYSLRMDNVTVEKSYDTRVPSIDLDVNRWQQVIINLASNAQQAIVSAACSERWIRFETRLGDGTIELRVADSGPGISPEARTRLFEPFFTTKEAGTGLGLSICQGIVRDHGGTLELDSAYVDGSRFVIHIPATRATAGAAQEPGAGDARAPEGPGGSILLVDDEPAVREIVTAWLSRHGYAVDAHERADSALERLAESRPAVILVDVALPGSMDGLQLHDHLRREAPDLARRVVFVTGYASHDGLSQEIADRGAVCLHKPFDLRDLLEVVREIAGRRTEAGKALS